MKEIELNYDMFETSNKTDSADIEKLEEKLMKEIF